MTLVPIADPTYLRGVTQMLLLPKDWITHRRDSTILLDEARARKSTRLDIDLAAIPLVQQQLLFWRNVGYSHLAVPIGIRDKNTPVAVEVEQADGSMLPLLSTAASTELAIRFLYRLARMLTPGFPNVDFANVARRIKVVAESPSDHATTEIDCWPTAFPAQIWNHAAFNRWAHYISTNTFILASIELDQAHAPWTAQISSELKVEKTQGRTPMRDRIVLGEAWWAKKYYTEVVLPDGLSQEDASLQYQGNVNSGLVQAPAAQVLDHFSDGQSRMLSSTGIYTFQEAEVVQRFRLSRQGLLNFSAWSTALSFAALTGLALFLQIGARDQVWSNDGPGDRQSLVAILVLVPGLLATIAIRPGEHGLVARAYRSIRTLTAIPAILSMVVAFLVAVGLHGPSLRALCYASSFTTLVVLIYMLYRRKVAD